tara:strand:+ start:944 stop:1468 length:525 start_codon:yes stop_codon:yes gene_type:complete
MGTQAIFNLNSIDIDDLDASSATMSYPVGAQLVIKDSTSAMPKTFIYTKAHAALALGQPIVLIEGSGGDAELVTVAPATSADGQGELLGFPLAAITSGHYFFAQVTGVITAAAGTVAAGDHVEVLNAGTTLVVDGTSGSTTRSVRSIGIAKTATATGTITLSVMPGRRVHIAAS